MVRGTVPLSLDRNGYHVAWDAIPAWVCTQCGEPFFESREVDLIQRELTELDRESAALASAGSPASKPLAQLGSLTHMIKEHDRVV
jgi:YgiT-type zinc finger domain-containing protein